MPRVQCAKGAMCQGCNVLRVQCAKGAMCQGIEINGGSSSRCSAAGGVG